MDEIEDLVYTCGDQRVRLGIPNFWTDKELGEYVAVWLLRCRHEIGPMPDADTMAREIIDSVELPRGN